MQEGLKNLSMQERSIFTQEVLREGILTSDSVKAPQQCEATVLKEDKNKNGKRILEIVRETQITGKKARKLNKKKAKLENMQEATENRWKTSQTWNLQEAGSQDLNLAGTTELTQNGTSPWRSYMTIGGALTIRMMPRMARKHLWADGPAFGTLRLCHNRQIHIDGSIPGCWKNPLWCPAYLTRWSLRWDHFFPPVIN
jgi:hypothetical protein